MNKTEAAEYLGCSVRAVERYAAAGRLTGRYERGATGKVLAFDESELEALKAELEAPQPRVTAKSVTVSDGPTSSDITTLARVVEPDSADMGMQVLASLQAIATSLDSARQAPTIDVADKLLLKLDEAALLTGLSRQVLRAAIDEGTLKASQIGRAWRIRRADLETYLEGLF